MTKKSHNHAHDHGHRQAHPVIYSQYLNKDDTRGYCYSSERDQNTN